MFGRRLESARFQGIATFEFSKPQRALIIGDGDGRFSQMALTENPHLSIDSIERSSKMRKQASLRIQKLGENYRDRHRYIAHDVRDFSFANSEYDFVVAQFFLDCFSSNDANVLLRNFARTLKPNGKLIYVDFAVPCKAPLRWLGKGFITILYLFFRITTDIGTSRLPELVWPNSLRISRKQLFLKGLVTSEIRSKV